MWFNWKKCRSMMKNLENMIMLSRNIWTLENYLSQTEEGMNSPNSQSELHSVPLYTNRLIYCFDRLHNNAVKIQLSLKLMHWEVYWRWNRSLKIVQWQLYMPCRCKHTYTHAHRIAMSISPGVITRMLWPWHRVLTVLARKLKSCSLWF